MKKIIVVGYPKSGCTWVTRLVAELVGCPVAGFWQRGKEEIAEEGKERVSEYRCYKSHHQLSDLGVSVGESHTWLIYVLRDPRDIAVSGAEHFQFERFPRLEAFARTIWRGEKLYRHTLYPLLVRRGYRLHRMTDALLHGSAAVHNWVRVSWREHWQPFHRAGVPFLRYEDLLARPEVECARILEYLKLERSPERITASVQNQSFQRKKEKLLEQGETGRARFLRVGRSEQWRDKLPPELQRRFREALGTELNQWGYPA